MKHIFKLIALVLLFAAPATAFAGDMTEVPRSGQCKMLTEQQITEIQQSLTSRGFYDGPIDGVWHIKTLEAVKAYQASRQLAPNGELTTTDLEALGLDVTGLRQEYTTTIQTGFIRKHGNGPEARGKQSFQE